MSSTLPLRTLLYTIVGLIVVSQCLVNAKPVKEAKNEIDVYHLFLNNECARLEQLAGDGDEPLEPEEMESLQRQQKEAKTKYFNDYFAKLEQNGTRKFHPVRVSVTNSGNKSAKRQYFSVEICPHDLDPENLPKSRRRPDPIPETTFAPRTNWTDITAPSPIPTLPTDNPVENRDNSTDASSTIPTDDADPRLFRILVLLLIGIIIFALLLVCAVWLSKKMSEGF